MADVSTRLMNHSMARQLGQLMCDTTFDSLWLPAGEWTGRPPDNALRCRVGSGQATYHRFDPERRQHLITYGVRMIEAKQRPETAQGWLSSREILKRGYFDGQLSPLNLLAHTCCHEFAHLLQQSAGKRYRGSVHNRHFYRILDDLHRSGRAESVRQVLASRAAEQALPLSAATFTPGRSGPNPGALAGGRSGGLRGRQAGGAGADPAGQPQDLHHRGHRPGPGGCATGCRCNCCAKPASAGQDATSAALTACWASRPRNSGMQEPQLLPHFRLRPRASTLVWPARMALAI